VETNPTTVTRYTLDRNTVNTINGFVLKMYFIRNTFIIPWYPTLSSLY